jgi:hypothetical protein
MQNFECGSIKAEVLNVEYSLKNSQSILGTVRIWKVFIIVFSELFLAYQISITPFKILNV